MLFLFHDDNCGDLLDKDGECPTCKFHPDMQSTAFKPVSADLAGHFVYSQGRTLLGLNRKPIDSTNLLNYFRCSL
jgi:hypothetical protein